MINDSTSETGRPDSASVLGSDGRNDSSAMMVANSELTGDCVAWLVDIVVFFAGYGLKLDVSHNELVTHFLFFDYLSHNRPRLIHKSLAKKRSNGVKA